MPYEDLIEKHAKRTGQDPKTLHDIMMKESSGDKNNITGSYMGLFQLDKGEFKRNGGTGSIFDPEQNIMAAANKLAKESQTFKAKHGRDPKAADIYMVHQQGEAGYGAHLKNPEGVAWQNVRPFYTDAAAKKKGFASGDEYAKAAIWGNVPDTLKGQYGSVEKMTSKEFTELWAAKMEGREPTFSGDRPGGASGLVDAETPTEEKKKDGTILGSAADPVKTAWLDYDVPNLTPDMGPMKSRALR